MDARSDGAERGQAGPDSGDSGRSQDRYSARQISRLTRILRREVRHGPHGRCICPYCKHLEARWRAAQDEQDAAVTVVRVRCSQCQLQAIIHLPRP